MEGQARNVAQLLWRRFAKPDDRIESGIRCPGCICRPPLAILLHTQPAMNFLNFNVRFGSLADIRARIRDVRFTLNSGHARHRIRCLLSARSRLRCLSRTLSSRGLMRMAGRVALVVVCYGYAAGGRRLFSVLGVGA
jgi:hypothetical protein